MARKHRESTLLTKGLSDRLDDLVNERKAEGLSQKQIAEGIGVSSGALSEWCSDNKTIGIDYLVKIANYFHVSTDYLLGLTGTKTTEENTQIAAKTTGLSESAIESITSFWVQSQVYASKTLNAIIESEQFPDIVADLSTYLWGISYEKRSNGEVISVALTDETISKYGEMIQDAMIHRLGNSLSQIKGHLIGWK